MAKRKKGGRSEQKAYEPSLVAFSCWYCAYAAADTAGLGRMQYPADVRIIRVPCSGRISIDDILQAFVMGADAVFIGACYEGTCHFIDGNVKAKRIVNFAKRLLEALGIDPKRLDMFLMGAPDGRLFAEAVQEMTERAKELGPSSLKGLTPPTYHSTQREILRSQVKFIADGLGKKFTEPLIIPEPIEGLGEPKFDPEKCVGCGACEWVCPEDAITLIDEGSERKIVHWHWKCVACEQCVTACEWDAVEIEKKFDITSFLDDDPVVDIALELNRCPVCGGPAMTVRHVEEMIKAASDAGMWMTKYGDLYRVCWKCRQDQWEDAKRRPKPYYRTQPMSYLQCPRCREQCPYGLTPSPAHFHELPDECANCGICAEVCSHDKVTVKLKEILKGTENVFKEGSEKLKGIFRGAE